MRDLVPIGVGGEAEAARRRQAGARERREVRRLRPDRAGIGGAGASSGRMKSVIGAQPLFRMRHARA